MSGASWSRTCLLAAGLFVLSIAGCAVSPAVVETPPPAMDGALPGAPVSGAVFQVGFDRIGEIYLEPVDFGRLTLDGLTGLQSIEPTLTVRRLGELVELTVGGTVHGTFTAPAPGDGRRWAALIDVAVERGRAVSPPLRDATPEEIYEAVFDAVTSDLDPYSRYVSAAQAQSERASRDGYGGIGLLLEYDEAGRAIIQEVFRGGPAARAGVLAGEIIVGVNGQDTTRFAIEDLTALLRGPVDSVVGVTLESGEDRTRRSVEIRRARVIQNVVTTRLEDGVLILSVSRFNAATRRDVIEAIVDARSRLGAGAVGVILDLRGNPGGLLDQSVAVADLFIGGTGDIIRTRGRHPDSYQRFTADTDDIADGLPLVVLVDGRSASGSEVVAAALQDSGRAVVVGASSFGKGSVQTVSRLPNDGELFLTWSRIYAPSGYTLHRQGVMPTICTSNGITDADDLVRLFRSGLLPLPTDLAGTRLSAPDDEAALARLREACPWRAHDAELDVLVAKRLLADRTLFAEALAAAHPELAERPPGP